MSRFYQSLRTAGALVLSLSLIAPPVSAAGLSRVPLAAQTIPLSAMNVPAGAEVVEVQHRRDRRAHRPRAHRPDRDVRGPRHGPRHQAHQPRHNWHAQRSRHRRPGYRRANDGYFYPLAAFALGAIILQQHQQPQAVTPPRQVYNGWDHISSRNMAAHDAWCDNRYRSYSRTTKTFQPYDGPRRYCNSPYDNI